MARRLGLAVVLAALTLSACGGEQRPPAERDRAAPLPHRVDDTPPAPRRAAPQKCRVRWPRGVTVRGAIRRALLAGSIDRDRYARWRATERRARALVGRLTGRPREEMAAVLRVIDRLAWQRALRTDRLAPALLTLQRNADVWASEAPPPPGTRRTFGRDPLIFQYYAGHGFQLQPLASFGVANALLHDCADPRKRCRSRRLRALLDRLIDVSSQRAGYRAWEAQFDFGSGRAPWVSGMTQGTAAQALARAGVILGDGDYLRVAKQALGAFERRPPAGVAVRVQGGTHYAMYSFAPDLRILNGHLQAVIALHDVTIATGSRRAGRLYRSGERAARRALAAYDTGAWSLYASGGRESNLGYHQLVAGFLGRLCDRTRKQAYCRSAARFKRYEHEPPRIALAVARRTRRGRAAPLRFTLSKVSDVEVDVWGRRGLALHRDLRLTRGAHAFAFTPSRRGTYRVKVLATGLSGPSGSARATIRVTAPRPKAKRARRGTRVARGRAGAAGDAGSARRSGCGGGGGVAEIGRNCCRSSCHCVQLRSKLARRCATPPA